jgi:hypothetical protein
MLAGLMLVRSYFAVSLASRFRAKELRALASFRASFDVSL